MAQTYAAQAGDNLMTIAEQFYKKVIGANPDKLGVDLTLKIPLPG